MKVIHICSYFYTSKIYKKLCEELSKHNIDQYIYVPLRNDFNKKETSYVKGCKLVKEKAFSYIDRFFYFRKIKKIQKAFYSRFSKIVDKSDILHAHSLFINGAVAFRINKKQGNKYIVAVRSTDVKVFFKYMFFLRGFGVDILLNASKIIFISPVYQNIVLKKYIPKEYRQRISNKSVVIPNGIDEFWHKNRCHYKKQFSEPFNVLFVGELIRRKNAMKLINAVMLLRKCGFNINLTIIGSGPFANLIKFKVRECDFIELIPWVSCKERLLDLYRESDVFAMPSVDETFGLVYIEAISQGLPVIYSIAEGIDGYFDDDTHGIAVAPEKNHIANGIKKILINRDLLDVERLVDLSNFDWSQISVEYKRIYECINY